MLNISHTTQTLVGDEFVRGVSGGERKRVSIAEMMATRARVQCWDNSTRGLDASTALDFIRSLRLMTDVLGQTTFVTLRVVFSLVIWIRLISPLGIKREKASMSFLIKFWYSMRAVKFSMVNLLRLERISNHWAIIPSLVKALPIILRGVPTRTNDNLLLDDPL